MEERVFHTLEPVWNERSRILILGSFPSPKSRQLGFYYGHPQNRFWKVLSEVFQKPCPQTNEEKKAFALEEGIALWDVLHSCMIRGADDSSIREPQENDLNRILSHAPIELIVTTGKKANELYSKYCKAAIGREAICLPSTSPANCAMSLERLVEAYQVLRLEK